MWHFLLFLVLGPVVVSCERTMDSGRSFQGTFIKNGVALIDASFLNKYHQVDVPSPHFRSFSNRVGEIFIH